MGDSLSQTLLEARKLANTDPDRARAMFEALAGTSPCGSWSEAQVELAYLAYHQWRLDEVAFRANAVLSLSDVATPWATAVAGVLTNLAADWSDGPVDEDLLLRSAIACVDANDPYNAAVARSLVASSRLRAGDRRAAIGHLRAAADLYEAAGSMTGGGRRAASPFRRVGREQRHRRCRGCFAARSGPSGDVSIRGARRPQAHREGAGRRTCTSRGKTARIAPSWWRPCAIRWAAWYRLSRCDLRPALGQRRAGGLDVADDESMVWYRSQTHAIGCFRDTVAERRCRRADFQRQYAQ